MVGPIRENARFPFFFSLLRRLEDDFSARINDYLTSDDLSISSLVIPGRA